uniref:Protein phosphatase n=1 Tax=Noctiluca scintillans TaxID=2966 RepID=A0A7S1B087_NOCSC|eukprot:CAMPEP_0194494946 /NCGR_PEP_ID=MMETSP0253-20130528/12695_1 /TAXON_ID=2966 /ORGANISM="Noctiluca scintillans" /LENGTH=497 /DNA_ID=CAMNT_0039336135 /DNA_START=146 /DNA_END=1639 /DNA_ORIENTATION=-
MDVPKGKTLAHSATDLITIDIPERVAISIPVASADASTVVEVIFSCGRTCALSPASDVGLGKVLYSVPFRDTWLAAGVHTFYFTVCGRRVLSAEHPVHGGLNAALFSEALKRSIVFSSEAANPLELQPNNSAGIALVQRTESNSVCGGMSGQGHICLASDTREEFVQQERHSDTEPEAAFTDEVFQGMFNSDLCNRLDGHELPAGPEPALRFWPGGHQMKKRSGKCEDAFFTDAMSLGVADGVGEMRKYVAYGVDSAAYAHDLVTRASASLKPDGSAAHFADPKDRAAAAVEAAEREAKAFGASTLCVLSLEGNCLGAANLGDSGFLVLRKNARAMEIVARSREQQHCPNCPFQLLRLPPALVKKFKKMDQNKDSFTDCETYHCDLRLGDLVIMYTDGLSDNLYDHEILEVANRSLSPAFAELLGVSSQATPPERVAQALVVAAHERSVDPTAKTPWSGGCQNGKATGGKQDDITVVAAWVMVNASGPRGEGRRIGA